MYQGKCTNEVFIADANAYATVEACCNINFGLGTYGNGGCNFVDTCNPHPTQRPTPRPTSKPTGKPISNIIPPVPVTPAPTPCGDQRFFFVNGVCTNEVFISGVFSYGSLTQCCDINFGTDSLMNRDCDYGE